MNQFQYAVDLLTVLINTNIMDRKQTCISSFLYNKNRYILVRHIPHTKIGNHFPRGYGGRAGVVPEYTHQGRDRLYGQSGLPAPLMTSAGGAPRRHVGRRPPPPPRTAGPGKRRVRRHLRASDGAPLAMNSVSTQEQRPSGQERCPLARNGAPPTDQ